MGGCECLHQKLSREPLQRDFVSDQISGVVNVAKENNIETVRQVAELLIRENSTLWERIEKLTTEKSQLKGATPEQLELELASFRELLTARERQLFAKSSEKRPRTCPLLPEPDEAASQQTGHGPTGQKQLECIEGIHELPAEERECEHCGGNLTEMDDRSEDSEEISVVRRSFVVVRHRRRKYRCRGNGTVKTAPGPAKLIPGGRYSPEFAVEVALGKYLDHLPLERQVRIMERQGLTVTSQTLWDQIEALACHLELWAGLTRFLDDPRIPLDNNLVERAIRGPVVGRKNHYGSRSRRGTEVAALYYSLIETAKLLGVEPQAYLLEATSAAMKEPGRVSLPSDLLSTAA